MELSKTLDSSMSADSFWISANILINKPHVVNKRLWGCKVIYKCFCTPLITSSWCPTSTPKLQALDKLSPTSLGKLLSDLNLHLCKIPKNGGIEVILLELLPKMYTESHAFQLVCMDKGSTTLWFLNVTPEVVEQTLAPDYTYVLQLKYDKVILKAQCQEKSKSYHWLVETVLSQFIKWGEENDDPIKQTHQASLTLVLNDKYYTKYNELKLKYGKEMVKIWPECTDSSKFVYEDVAIATYLLLLWEDERLALATNKLQTFVDLGCGNGLLVYILAMEGHGGVGVDVRKRQIWDIYPTNVKLEEKTVTPSDMNLFPDTDWIIGNHSDELTPWIPVVAARSSYKCNFFLLPCCAYNFDGTKYQRQNSSKSQYTEYLEYIRNLCDECGFKVDVDRLKIPSTKRICIVGRGRTYPEKEHHKNSKNIQNLINHQTTINFETNVDSNVWIADFKARDPVERVRNCTQIDKILIEKLVEKITNYLLKDCNTEARWSSGKHVEINELVNLISHDDLKLLKSECGGLQTLMKNQHHIFKVQGGKVQLRHPKTVEEVNNEIKTRKLKANKSKNIQLQQKPCWFFNNHPQGCPLTQQTCSFLHNKFEQKLQ